MKSSTFFTPDGPSTPAKADSAVDAALGVGVQLVGVHHVVGGHGAPLLNLTPWRILNVQTSALPFGDQLVASTG